MRAGDKKFMRAHLHYYPFLAQAPTSTKPQWVPGDHVSVRLKIGWRVWGFRTKEARDQFVLQFHAEVFE
jgi:hypothetical protein